jgi:hypothetical protein
MKAIIIGSINDLELVVLDGVLPVAKIFTNEKELLDKVNELLNNNKIDSILIKKV